LLDRFSRAAGLPSAQEIFTHLDLDLTELPLANAVGRIVGRKFAINGNDRTLPEYLESSPAMMKQDGRIQQWSEQLLGVDELIAQNDPNAARDAAAAVARAHFFATKNGGDLNALRARAICLVRACFSNGVRAGTRPATPQKSLAESLFNLRDEEILNSLP